GRDGRRGEEDGGHVAGDWAGALRSVASSRPVGGGVGGTSPAVAGAVLGASLPRLCQAVADESPILRPTGHARFKHERWTASPFAMEMQLVFADRQQSSRRGPLFNWLHGNPCER